MGLLECVGWGWHILLPNLLNLSSDVVKVLCRYKVQYSGARLC